MRKSWNKIEIFTLLENKWYYLFKFIHIPSIMIIITTILDPCLLHLLITRTFKNSIEPSLLPSNLIKIHHHKFPNTDSYYSPSNRRKYSTFLPQTPLSQSFIHSFDPPPFALRTRQIFESNVPIRLSSLLPVMIIFQDLFDRNSV